MSHQTRLEVQWYDFFHFSEKFETTARKFCFVLRTELYFRNHVNYDFMHMSLKVSSA